MNDLINKQTDQQNPATNAGDWKRRVIWHQISFYEKRYFSFFFFFFEEIDTLMIVLIISSLLLLLLTILG